MISAVQARQPENPRARPWARPRPPLLTQVKPQRAKGAKLTRMPDDGPE